MLNPILTAHGFGKGGGGIEYKRVTAAIALRDKQGIIADTSGGSFIVSLPNSPREGTQCSIADGGNWSTNPLTVDPVGAAIENQAAGETLTLDIGSIEAQFVYTGTKWKVFVKVVSSSGGVVSTEAVQTINNKTLGTTSVAGNMSFTGTGRRILGDFSNAVHSLRTLFQSGTANASTVLGVIPNGSSQISQLNLYNNSDPTNASVGLMLVLPDQVSFRSAATGTGQLLPMTWVVNNTEAMSLGVNNVLLVGKNRTDQYGPSLVLNESGHATSRRATVDFGTGWALGQDSPGNGTKDFFLYSKALSLAPLIVTTAGHVTPGATNTFDLGSTTARWRNIYTQDLHLSNGIGDYTMIEGEEDLFLVNNKNGKHYKFALIQVDPSIVPAKSEAADGA